MGLEIERLSMRQEEGKQHHQDPNLNSSSFESLSFPKEKKNYLESKLREIKITPRGKTCDMCTPFAWQWKVFQIFGGSGGLKKIFFHLSTFSSENNDRNNLELCD